MDYWKLIELLNEYENRDEDQQIEWRLWEWDKGEKGKVRGIVNEVYMWWVSELVVCSAYYWFIKWLVENDKVKIPHELDELPAMYWYDYDSVECKADRLLMLLSISDTPIEDLILYLK